MCISCKYCVLILLIKPRVRKPGAWAGWLMFLCPQGLGAANWLLRRRLDRETVLSWVSCPTVSWLYPRGDLRHLIFHQVITNGFPGNSVPQSPSVCPFRGPFWYAISPIFFWKGHWDSGSVLFEVCYMLLYQVPPGKWGCPQQTLAPSSLCLWISVRQSPLMALTTQGLFLCRKKGRFLGKV